MMELTMLGTGCALVTELYNTCFVLEENEKPFLVDCGGGKEILGRLIKTGYDPSEVKDIFITHKHIDHMLGAIWMMRWICQKMSGGTYLGDARIYAHEEVCRLLRTFAIELLTPKQSRFVGERLKLIEVKDGDSFEIIGRPVTFFDIHSAKARQFGFAMTLADGRRLACCGDEPFHPANEGYVKGADWLLHEAFCLYSERETFHPYEKSHSTVKEACETAENLGVKNLLLYHTEEKNRAVRKVLYTAEGKQFFSGNLFVPNELEHLTL